MERGDMHSSQLTVVRSAGCPHHPLPPPSPSSLNDVMMPCAKWHNIPRNRLVCNWFSAPMRYAHMDQALDYPI